MELDKESEHRMVIDATDCSQSMLTDSSRGRFPYCIVWSPLTVISLSSGMLEYVDRMESSWTLQCSSLPTISQFNGENRGNKDDYGRDLVTWDDALPKATQEFQHLNYSLFTCNCHTFVAYNLNRPGFRFGRGNVVNLAILFLSEGRWVNKAAIIKTLLPFCIAFGLGLLFGGSTFLTAWAAAFLLVGWFILGTYCFREMIHL